MASSEIGSAEAGPTTRFTDRLPVRVGGQIVGEIDLPGVLSPGG